MPYWLLHIEVHIVPWLLIASLCIMAIIPFLYLRTKRKYVRAERLRMQLQAQTREMDLKKQQIQQGTDMVSMLPITAGLHQIHRKELISETFRKTRERMAVDIPVDADERDKIILAMKKLGAAHQWDEFELRFLQVHLDFNKKMNDLSPGLSSSERRLCYFLLLDMSTKEIAIITGQSNRAVELGRIRLRKKLGLTKINTSLFEFLSKL